MDNENWLNLIGTQAFWGGVLASIMAAIILWGAGFIFRNTFEAVSETRKQSQEEHKIFDEALKLSSPYAPFAYGVVQGRALRYFITAVFIAQIGDALGFIWPFNIVLYCLSFIFLFQSLRWLYRIEEQAKQILKSGKN